MLQLQTLIDIAFRMATGSTEALRLPGIHLLEVVHSPPVWFLGARNQTPMSVLRVDAYLGIFLAVMTNL